MTRCYTELIQIPTFEERFEYLKLSGRVADETFGFDRWVNQMFYQRSPEWRSIRKDIIIRDNGCDLGMKDHDIKGPIYVHHINPMLPKDIYNAEEWILNPEFLICTSFNTHQAIHYGDISLIPKLIERSCNDTCPWKL